MSRDEVRALIVTIIQDVLPDEDVSKLKPNVRIRDQLQMDSMAFLDMIMELYKRSNLSIPEEDYRKLATLDSVTDYVFNRLNAANPA